MEENKVKNAELQAETEKLKAELKAKLQMQRALEQAAQEKASLEQAAQENSASTEPAQEIQEEASKEETQVVEPSEDENGFEEIMIEDASIEDEKKKIKNRIFNIIYDLLIIVGVGLLLFGGYSMYQDYVSSKESQESYEKIKDNYIKVPNNEVGNSSEGNTESTEPARPKEWYEQIWVDLEGLQTQVNEDIIGWIYFENEDISYPILYSADNNEYDRVRYDLVYAMCGSITLEAANKWDFSDIRNLIYGHNMRDLSMFGKLKYYKNEGYYQDHQYFQLIYDGVVYRYQIFSYFEVNETEVSYVRVNFSENSTYEDLLEKLQSHAMHETGVEVSAEDKTVTLLTCADDKTKRLLVNAVLVDQHVMPNADGTYPDVEPETEDTGTEDPGTEPSTDDPNTEPDTQDPSTEPDDRFEQQYTYTEMNQTMWATTGVKIRNQPSADSVRMGYLAKGQAVQVIARCNENGWYRIQLRKGVGYVNGSYLTDVDPHVHTEIPGGTVDAHIMCEGCGMILSAEHVYVDEVITEATTTTAGEMKHTCECGYSYTSEIPPITETPENPSTEDPSTEDPSTEDPSTEAPSTENPSTEDPSTEDPSTENPSTEDPSTEDPSTEDPSTEDSSTEDPSTEDTSETPENLSETPEITE